MKRLVDKYGRVVDYLRISLTDRCNFRCFYCKPIKEFHYIPHDEILRFEELVFFINTLGEYGLKKIKITGGEPFLRKGIIDFIKELEKYSVSITTNGFFLEKFVHDLKKTKVRNINISLDSFKRDRFKKITGVDALDKVLSNIILLKKEGFFVKINAVMMKQTLDEINDFIEFSEKYTIPVRFIELMPISKEVVKEFIPEDTFKKLVEKSYKLIPYNEKLGEGPSRYYKVEDQNAVIGFISSITHNFCSTCNKIRITPDGKLRVCLALDEEVDLKEEIKARKKIELIEKVKFALSRKPYEHNMKISERVSKRSMIQIGG